MIEIRAYAANFARLVAAENAPNLRPRRSAAIFLRRDWIRGHDEIVLEQTIASAGADRLGPLCNRQFK